MPLNALAVNAPVTAAAASSTAAAAMSHARGCLRRALRRPRPPGTSPAKAPGCRSAAATCVTVGRVSGSLLRQAAISCRSGSGRPSGRDGKGQVRERRAGDACQDPRCAHPACWIEEAHVTELTGLLREGPGGDQLKAWPKAVRVFARRERPHPGAQLSLFETVDGWRYSLWATNLPVTTRAGGASAPTPTPPTGSTPGLRT